MELLEHLQVIKKLTKNILKMVGYRYLVIQNMVVRECLKQLVHFLMKCFRRQAYLLNLYSELSIGAYNCLFIMLVMRPKINILPKMVEGKWSGTMCLTEPVCGTDLGLLKTKAAEQTDGTFKISGQKIFITSGDHDLTENIIHLVLARATDSPSGTKGISLFLVPKFIVNEDGT